MRKVAVAEWILSLVTSREWAATTVGDCLEDTSGAFAFWRFLLRTAAALCWRDLWGARRRLLGLALCGIVMELALMALIMGGGLLLWVSVVYDFWGTDAVQKGMPGWAVSLLLTTIGHVFIPLLGGRLVGRFSDGREMAAGVALAALHFAIGLLNTSFYWSGTLAFAANVLNTDAIFIMAGALTWRAQHPRTA